MNVRLASLLTASLLAACSAGNDSSSTGNPSSTTTGGSGGAGAGPTGGAGAAGGSGGAGTAQFMGTGGSTNCPDEDADTDGDGWTIAEGDCNDCDKNVAPSAIEVIGPPEGMGGAGGAGGAGAGGASGGGGEGGAYVPVDEDCDGEIDEAAEPACDDGLALNSSSPIDGARAIELCRQANGPKDWGIVSAAYTRSNGAAYTVDAHVGLQASFGPNVPPLRGGSLLSLSSGFSRLPGQPGACTNNSCGTYAVQSAPPGYPQDVPGCLGDTEIHDDVALDLVLRAPSNATGYKFNFKFYSFEYEEYVCTMFNDQFIALVAPPPMGSQDGNISFDSMGNPVSVNIAFFDVCDPMDMDICGGVANCCPAGPAQLLGTGFDNAFGSNFEDAGGTSWLQTKAPVVGGEEFNIRFAIWDTGDNAYDSTVVIDNFEWIANGGTVLVETIPQ